MKKIALFILLFVGLQSAKAQEKPPNVVMNPVDTTKKYFHITDGIPTFVGGQDSLFRYLARNTKYPKSAIEKNIQGTVYVNFLISDSGKIKNVRIIKGITNAPELDSAAVNVVRNMPNWIPVRVNGKNATCGYSLPIKFSISEGDEKQKKN